MNPEVSQILHEGHSTIFLLFVMGMMSLTCKFLYVYMEEKEYGDGLYLLLSYVFIFPPVTKILSLISLHMSASPEIMDELAKESFPSLFILATVLVGYLVLNISIPWITKWYDAREDKKAEEKLLKESILELQTYHQTEINALKKKYDAM